MAFHCYSAVSKHCYNCRVLVKFGSFQGYGRRSSVVYLHNAFYRPDHRKNVNNSFSTDKPDLISLILDENRRFLDRKKIFLALKYFPDEYIPPDKWEFVINEISNSSVNAGFSTNLLPFLLNSPYAKETPQLGQSIIDYILSNKNLQSVPTLMTILTYIQDKPESSQLFDSLVTQVQSLLDESPNFKLMYESKFASILLSKTHLKENELTYIENVPGLNLFITRVFKAVESNNWPEFFHCMNKLGDEIILPSKLYELIFQKLQKEPHDVTYDVLQKFLKIMGEQNWYMHEKAAFMLKQLFESMPNQNWNGIMKVTFDDLNCRYCSSKMEPFSITRKQTTKLAEDIRAVFMAGENSDYFYCSPSELLNLDTFIKSMPVKTGGYHLVIDLLNILNGVSYVNTKVSPAQKGILVGNFLVDVLKTLKLSGKSSLDICAVSKYLSFVRWNYPFFDSVRRVLGPHVNISLFTIDRRSHDDVFACYIALLSGPKTYLLSNDTYRQYRCRLDEGTSIFRRWQQSRQVLFKQNNIFPPKRFPSYVQGSMDKGWHIPYEDGSSLKNSFLPPDKWLCLSQKSKK